MKKEYTIDFDEINLVANQYFENKDMLSRSRLMELVLGAIIDETPAQCDARIEKYPYSDPSEDWVWFFGKNAPKDWIIDIIIEAIGEKKLKNGEVSRSGFDFQKGVKFTTYLIALIEKRITDVYDKYDKRKNNTDLNVREDGFDNSDENGNRLKNSERFSKYEYVNLDELSIVIMAKFISQLLKNKKAPSMTRGIYSWLFVNYSRKYHNEFEQLNKISDTLFEPSDLSFINKMTRFPEEVVQDFIGLYHSDLSDYVYEKKLYKSLSESESDIKVLLECSVSDFYGFKSMNYQKRKIFDQLSEALK